MNLHRFRQAAPTPTRTPMTACRKTTNSLDSSGAGRPVLRVFLKSAKGRVLPRRHISEERLRFASSEKSVGHRYASMGAGSSARAAREPDVG